MGEIKFNMSKQDKKKMQKYTEAKLNEIGGRQGKVSTEGKFMFVFLLVQYLWSLDVGISCTANGEVTITDSGKLYEFGSYGNTFEFINNLIWLRNRLAVVYGSIETIKEIDSVWYDKELKFLCGRLNINFGEHYDEPDFAKLMIGE